jgi:amino acid transporter
MPIIEVEKPAISQPSSEPASGLKRGMKLIGVLLITLSAVSPASSVFIIVPGILATSGSGAFLSMCLGAIVGVFMSLVYAELSSAYPLSGGEYAIVGRVVGPSAGFIVLGVNLVGSILIPAVFALGVSSYLSVIDPSIPVIPTAIATIILTTILAALNIKTNALVTGIFLVIEILAMVVLVVLGFLHVSRPITDIIFHPVVLSGTSLISAPISMIGMATSVAIFAYNGYGSAVYFGEETPDARRHIARAILWALVITVISELLPMTAVLLGTPDLKAFLGSSNMFGDFIAARGGNTLNTIISLGIALAIFNAVIACILVAARFTYSTGRDNVWPAPISRALAQTHSRFHSPWIATLLCGVLAALACLVNENVLFVITGTGIIVVYASLCVAVIVGRHRGTLSHGHYRMPFFPLAPITALLMMVYVIYTNWQDPVIGRPSLITTAAIVIISAAYYAFILRRRGAWVLQGPQDN